MASGTTQGLLFRLRHCNCIMVGWILLSVDSALLLCVVAVLLCEQVQSYCLNTPLLLVHHACTFLYAAVTIIIDVALGKQGKLA